MFLKRIGAFLFFAGVILSPLKAIATEIAIDASIRFVAGISATNGKDINFGVVYYQDPYDGEIRLGTNSTTELSKNSSGLILVGGEASAGDVSISGDRQSTVDISCESSAILRVTDQNTLNLEKIEMSIDKGTAFGTATPCSGLKTPIVSVDLGANPTPKIFLGGAINFSGARINPSGLYSIQNAGGNPALVRVVYQ